MNRIKIAYTDFWKGFKPETFPLTRMIRSFENVEFVDNMQDSDLLLFSCAGNNHWFISDNCIKLFYTGENLTPDFNACDYAIGFDWMDFGDRYLRMPYYYLCEDICERMERKHLLPLKDILKSKTDFCSITISNTNRNSIFMELFRKLSAYKKVDSGGKWNNNIGGPTNDKYSFDLSHKFSIVCENSSSPGYTTEKIVQAFAANCIPIYWGDPTIGNVFNKKAFINVSDFCGIDAVVEKVKEIDLDDNVYYKMLQEPAIIDDRFLKENQMAALKAFLSRILTCPLVKRRNRDGQGKLYINNYRYYVRNRNDVLSRIKSFVAKSLGFIC